MLALGIKEGQRIRIGDDIEVVISEIRGDNVRVAITAPKQIPIIRLTRDGRLLTRSHEMPETGKTLAPVRHSNQPALPH